MKKTLGRIFLIFLFLGSCYLFFLKPKLESQNKLEKAKNILSEHHTNLLQNRLNFIELTKLNPNSGTFDLEILNLTGILKKTNEDGLKILEAQPQLPKVDKELSERYDNLLSETKAVYEKQKNLLEKAFATNSYKAGVEILKSDESISILTDQTNLILEFEYYLTLLKELR